MLGGEPMTVGMREMQERLHLFGPVKWHKSSIPACQLHEQCRKCLTRVEVVARTDEVCIIGEALLGKGGWGTAKQEVPTFTMKQLGSVRIWGKMKQR